MSVSADPRIGSELLGYRFPCGTHVDGAPIETVPGGLGGHAMGNLLIAAMTAMERGRSWVATGSALARSTIC